MAYEALPMTKILIIEARFYDKISDKLLGGACRALEAAKVKYDIVTVSGALEIPAVVAMAASKYDGFVALGCVERGETYHFEIVANESSRGLMDLAVHKGLLIGNGILTVENEKQALERAGKQDKGGFAANACLELVQLKKQFKAK